MRKTRRARRTRMGRRRRSKNTMVTRAFATKVHRVIRQTAEKKYYSFSSNTAPISDLGTLLRLTEVAQGTTDVTRIGDQLTIRSLQFNFSALVADSTNLLRLVIFQWFEQTGTIPTYPDMSQILIDTGSGRAVFSPYSHDYRYDFKVLFDRTYVLDGVQVPVITRKIFIKRFPPKHRKIQFVGASNTNYTNGLFALLVSDSAAATHPTVTYSGKFNFSDV